jgi:GNAT superfamily N-acetyltransferase
VGLEVAKRFTLTSPSRRCGVAIPAHRLSMDAGTEVALRLIRADARLWSAWLESLSGLPGDPYEAELHRFNNSVALYVHRVPLAYYNRVLLAEDADESVVEEIASFYQRRMMPCRFDVNPYTADERLLDALDVAGFRPVGFQSNLLGSVDYSDEKLPQQLTVSEVTDTEIEFFAGFYNRSYYNGTRVPRALTRFREATIRARHGRPEWRLYLCRIDGVPAAGALLHINDGVATLTGAATAPSFRGRGCQRALLRTRINEAARVECELVVSRCTVGSESQRNLERAGLQTRYTKVIWEHRGIREHDRRTELRRLPSPREPEVLIEARQLHSAAG